MSSPWSGPALTAAQMRACESDAVATGKTSFSDLMERAGAAVVEAILTHWSDLLPQRAVILCGPGNNGGDGFVVARLLQDRGWSVTVLTLGDPSKMSDAAARNRQRWDAKGSVRPFDETQLVEALEAKPDLVVDALFGSGLSRPLDLPPRIANALAAWREAGGRQVAVDIPSGLCSDTGAILGTALPADLTVTFHRPFLGNLLGQGPQLCGQLLCVPIGLPDDGTGVPVVRTVRDAISAATLDKSPHGHKYDHGHALVLSGGVGRGGAARLAARAALRIGAGAVTVGCPPAALIENAAQLTAVMLRRVAGSDDLNDILSDDRINAICLGPGLGTREREADLVRCALQATDRALALDADALTLLAQDEELFGRLHDGCVLTPHPGEFARLFPDLAERGRSQGDDRLSKVEITRRAAARAGCTVLLKGPDTVIAGPDGRCAIHAAIFDRAVPWLATAGSGDVLAGLVVGLLARKIDAFTAAIAGAALHAEAGRIAGPGLIAEDLPEAIPAVLRREMQEGAHDAPLKDYE